MFRFLGYAAAKCSGNPTPHLCIPYTKYHTISLPLANFAFHISAVPTYLPTYTCFSFPSPLFLTYSLVGPVHHPFCGPRRSYPALIRFQAAKNEAPRRGERASSAEVYVRRERVFADRCRLDHVAPAPANSSSDLRRDVDHSLEGAVLAFPKRPPLPPPDKCATHYTLFANAPSRRGRGRGRERGRMIDTAKRLPVYVRRRPDAFTLLADAFSLLLRLLLLRILLVRINSFIRLSIHLFISIFLYIYLFI